MLVARGARQGVKRALRRSVEGGLWRSGRRSEARHEQGLVDAALEDRDAQLHALRDDVPSLEAGLAGELSGRQVNSHRSCEPPACLQRAERIARVSDNLADAAAAGCDAFLTGEAREYVMGEAAESGIHFFAAGHYATETFGIRRIGELVASEFGVDHCWIDLPNPV